MAKILIVEDEVIDELGPVNLLKRHHHIAKSARTIAEAVAAMRTERFDLILLDIKLKSDGDHAGFSILNRKRRIPMNASTPVIIVTGKVTEELIRRKTDERDRIFRIIEKPYDTARLLEAVNSVVGPSE